MIALLPLVLFADAVVGRVVFFERDIYAYWVPNVEAFVRAVAGGAWPLWDPLTNFGRPLLADPSMQIAYPPTWLNLVLPPGPYYTLFVVAHCAWAGLGTLFLAREWGLGGAAAAWAGASWMLSGPLLSTASLYHHFASASWMAWVLLALERVVERPGARSAAWLGLAAAGMALAGSADICVMTAGAAAVRVGFAAVGPERARLAPAALAGALASACVLAALVSALQWWPTLAHVAVGSRGSAGPAASMYWSAHPASLLDVVFPGLVAEMPLGTAWRAAVFEGRGPLLRSLYVGLPAVALAAIALLGRWRLRWLVAGLAAAFLIGALGRFTPVYPALAGLPVVRLLRFPVKLAVPATLFLCLLSGAGIDVLRAAWSAPQRRRMIVAVAVIAALCAVALAGALAAPKLAAAMGPWLAPDTAVDVPARLRSSFARVGVLALVAAGALAVHVARGPSPRLLAAALVVALADLLVAARGAVRVAPAELLRHRPPLLEAFPRNGQPRLYAFQYGLDRLNQQFTRPPAGWDPEWAWALGHAERLAPPIATRWGISGSFDGDFTGLTPVALTRLTAAVHEARGDPAGWRLLRMASVTDVVSFEDTLYGRPPRAEALSVYTGPVRVFAVADPLPRAYVVAGVRRDGPPDQASVVMEPGFDERREVALDASSGKAASAPVDDAGRAEVVARRSDRLTVAVAVRRPGVLVVTEGYDPGWRAWVDGAPAPVWRANAIFRAVPVGEGDHHVEMRYRPPSAAGGALASVVGAVLAAVLIGRRTA